MLMAPQGTETLREGVAPCRSGGNAARRDSEGGLISREGQPRMKIRGDEREGKYLPGRGQRCKAIEGASNQ